MRIAQVAPLYQSVPPASYGGTERIVSYLTEELVNQGHEVTLFASGDSKTNAKLISPCDQALRTIKAENPIPHHMVELKMVQDHIDDFDIVHYHIDYLHYPFSRFSKVPYVTTMHWRMDHPDLQGLYQVFDDIPLISISDAQRAPQPHAKWISTVYHGFPQDLFRFYPERGDYLAFMSRLAPVKRVDRAIKIAKRTGIKLKIAGNINPEDEKYFDNHIAWQLDDPLIEYVGEVGDEQKAEFLGNSLCLLFPIDWPEPFGMVMAEAMACGTPVVAFDNGSVRELIKPGINGFVVDSINEAVEAVQKLDQINRAECRNYFEDHFHVSRMAAKYLEAYEMVIEQWSSNELLY